jgi:hypothetical protein
VKLRECEKKTLISNNSFGAKTVTYHISILSFSFFSFFSFLTLSIISFKFFFLSLHFLLTISSSLFIKNKDSH